ncbi:MAG: hypothetical protein ACPGD5_03690 [Salibacteraceae bacterium]
MQNDLTLIEFLLKSIKALKRHSKVALAITFLCVILGFVLLGLKKDEFESSINAQSSTLDYPTIQSSIGFIDKNLKIKNYKTISSFLGLPEDHMRNLKSISVSHLKRKTINTNSIITSFNVVFTVYNTDLFETCPEILHKSFNNNKHISSRLQSQRKRLEYSIKEISTSINQVDSISVLVKNLLVNNSGKMIGNIITSPDEIASNKIALVNSLASHQEALENTQAVNILNQTNDFNPLKSKWIYPLAFLFIGLILSLIYVFIIEVYKGIREL